MALVAPRGFRIAGFVPSSAIKPFPLTWRSFLTNFAGNLNGIVRIVFLILLSFLCFVCSALLQVIGQGFPLSASSLRHSSLRSCPPGNFRSAMKIENGHVSDKLS
jgi:hypothetical protein